MHTKKWALKFLISTVFIRHKKFFESMKQVKRLTVANLSNIYTPAPLSLATSSILYATPFHPLLFINCEKYRYFFFFFHLWRALCSPYSTDGFLSVQITRRLLNPFRWQSFFFFHFVSNHNGLHIFRLSFNGFFPEPHCIRIG